MTESNEPVQQLGDESSLQAAAINRVEAMLVDPAIGGYDPTLVGDYIELFNRYAARGVERDIDDPEAMNRAHLRATQVLLLAAGVSFDRMPSKDNILDLKIPNTSHQRYLRLQNGQLIDATHQILDTYEDLADLVITRSAIAEIDANHNYTSAFGNILSEETKTTTEREEGMVANVVQLEIISIIEGALLNLNKFTTRQVNARIRLYMDGVMPFLKKPSQMATYQFARDTSSIIGKFMIAENDPIVRELLNHVGYITTNIIKNYDQIYPTMREELAKMLQASDVKTETPSEFDPSEDNVPEMTQEVITVETGPAPFEVVKMISDLRSQLEAFNRYWFDAGRKWRENGFSDLMASLVKNGLVDKVEAPKLIGLLARLDANSLIDLDFAQRDFESGFAQQSDIQAQFLALQNEYGQYKEVSTFAREFFLTNIQKQAQFARDRWGALAGIISSQWSEGTRQNVADRLQSILFGQQVEAVAAAEPLATTGAIETIDAAANEEEIDVLRSMVDQLDEMLLPPGINRDGLIKQLRELGAGHNEQRVEWNKFEDLIALQKDFGGKLYRSKLKRAGQADGYGEIYYTLVFDLYGREFAIAESPLTNNATYIVDCANAPGTWLEMLTMSKPDLRDLKTKHIVHSPRAPYGEQHREKIIKYVFDVSAEQ